MGETPARGVPGDADGAAAAGSGDAACPNEFKDAARKALLALPGAPSKWAKDLTRATRVEGIYRFGDRPRDSFEVSTQQNALGIVRPVATRRNVLHLGRLEFAPAGAPAVRIRFERAGAKIAALTVSDPDLVLRATKA